MRAVVDTNVWVSAVINPSGHPARIMQAFLQDRFGSVVCCELLKELVDVMSRTHVRNRCSAPDDELEEFLSALRYNSTVVCAGSAGYHLRDPRDDFLLGAAIAGSADVIVTRDGDLRGDHVLPTYLDPHAVRVVSVQGFLDLLEAGEP